MKKIWLNPGVLIGIGAFVAGVLMRHIPLAVMGLVATLGTTFFLSAREAQQRPENRMAYDLSNQSRLELKPFEDLRRQIVQLVEQNQDISSVKVIGQEAIQDVDTMIEQAIRLLESKHKLKKSLEGKAQAVKSLADLQSDLAKATQPDIAESLKSAIQSREVEIASYVQVESAIVMIEDKMRETEAALSSLKASLAAGAAEIRLKNAEPEQLSEFVQRLKALGTSFEEANSTLEQKTL